MPKPREIKREKLTATERRLNRYCERKTQYPPEVLNKIVASAIKNGILTPKDFHQNNLSSIYQLIQTKKVNGISFMGYGSWEKYLEKVHKISLLNTPHTKERLNSIVKYALKQGLLTPKDFQQNNLSSVYYTIQNRKVKDIGFMGYGSWEKYLEKEHNFSLTKYKNQQRISELNKEVANALKQGFLTPKDFHQNNLSSVYSAIQNRKVKDIGFMGYGSWEKYLEKVHNFSLKKHRIKQKTLQLNKEVANALKQGILSKKDFQQNNLLSIYQAIYATKVNGISFLGYGSWENYLLAEHKELLKKLNIDLDKSFKNKIIALEKLDSAQKKYNILELIKKAKQGKLSLLFEKKQKSNKQKITPEEIDNMVALFLEKYKYNQEYFYQSKMPKEFKKYYEILRTKLEKPKIGSNSESFRGYGTWANYLLQEHNISLYKDGLFRSKQAFTKAELKFIQEKEKDIEYLVKACIHKKFLSLSNNELKTLILRVNHTAARNFNPKKSKLSTYIYSIVPYLANKIKKKRKKPKIISLDKIIGKEDNFTLKNIIPAKEQPPTKPDNEKILPLNILEKLYVDKKLKPKEVLIFLARFSGNTLEEAGSIFGLTRQRARQIEKKVVEKIREQIQNQ